jgi:signal transduction histidine kinase
MPFVTVLAVASTLLGILSVTLSMPWLAGGAAVLAGGAGILAWSSGRRGNPTKADPLSAQLITVQEEERKRLSRELHDSVGQIITAMKMELARVKGQEDGDAVRLQRARDHADEALQTIRNVSRMLRPTLLDDLGLQATLEWHTSEFARRTGIVCRLNYGLSGNSELPEAINTCIYRVVQEALNNCEKHAQATEVRVSATQSQREVQVQIVDNGRGLEAGEPGAGRLGILGMRERAHMLGGELRLESNDGHGTSVTLTIPAPTLYERTNSAR